MSEAPSTASQLLERLRSGQPVDATALREDPGELFRLAIEGDDATAIRLLIDRGADVNCAVRLSDGLYGESSPLFVAVEKGSIPMVKVLLEAGADPNRERQYGAITATVTLVARTPLHNAARSGRTEIVGLLLDAGADVNALERSDDSGFGSSEATPLVLAIQAKQMDTAGMLRRRGGVWRYVDDGWEEPEPPHP